MYHTCRMFCTRCKMFSNFLLCTLVLPSCWNFPLEFRNDTVRHNQLEVLKKFIDELSANAPYYLTERSPPRRFKYGDCLPCKAKRPPLRPSTTAPPAVFRTPEEQPGGLRIRVKEKNKVVVVKAPPPKTEISESNGTVVLSQPLAYWFEKKSLKTALPNGSVVLTDVIREAEGHTIYIIDKEKEILYYDDIEQPSRHEQATGDKGSDQSWLATVFSRWKENPDSADQDEECVFLLLCLIGVNPNDFGRVGQDVNNFLRGPQTDVLKTLSRYVTAVRIGTQSSTYNINNPCGSLSTTCMTRVAPNLPLWPFVNDSFSK